ncbi:protein disulfide-isomerase TMX3a, partial [Colossoma macropomum]|uniref:protein disulfide-isomerase TMX3a n=1 Tax=Colossoma macropomum TaxID=42526 RepID=UPI001865616C
LPVFVFIAISVGVSAFLLGLSVVSAYVEELDDKFNENRKSEPWLVEFYAPWCEYCKTFEPIWYEVGAELKSLGSPVNVGKLDTTVHSSVLSEFNIRGYPAIILVKGEKSFEYRGPRTKDGIIEFTNRVAGPVVRPLTSVQLFQHVMSRHDLFFLYIGGRSPLRGQYYKVAAEFIIYNYFFSASEEVLPQAVSLQEVPSVAVFKDGTYYLYNEERDGNLSDWVGRERFHCYFQMDSFTLYQMGETTKLVALAIVDEKNPTTDSIRYKALMEKVATEYRDHYNTKFQFGYMHGNDYINGFIMGELAMPSLIVMNMTVDGYYLPEQKVETMEELLQFLNSILNGRSKLLGGNGFLRRMKRLYYRAMSAVKTSFTSAPFVTCFLLSLPVGLVVMIVWGVCTAVPVDEDKADEGALLATGSRPAASQRKGTAEKSNEAKKED